MQNEATDQKAAEYLEHALESLNQARQGGASRDASVDQVGG